MNALNTSSQTPSATTGVVTFLLNPNSGVNSTRSSNEEPLTPNLELSKEEVFETNLTQIFTKGFLAVLADQEAVLKEMRDCLLQNNEQQCENVNSHLHYFWCDLNVRSGFL